MDSMVKPRADGYSSLRDQVTAAGLLESQPIYYWMKAIVALACLVAGVAAGILLDNLWLLAGVALFLGFASTQIALLAHDIGHRQGFRGRRLNAVARLVVADGMLAINSKSWMAKHSQHHASPNHELADPDIQFPMLAFSEEQIALRKRWIQPFIAFQAFLLPLLLPLQAINMRVNSARQFASSYPKVPVFATLLFCGHIALYGVFLVLMDSWQAALMFAAIHQGTFGLYNSLVFASNHKGMPVLSGAKQDFLTEQVVTSRNIKRGPVVDFLYGGLNYQIEHHLFPTMPRNQLHKAQVLVERFCAERQIPYHCTGVVTAYREVFVHMHTVSRSLRQRALAEPAG